MSGPGWQWHPARPRHHERIEQHIPIPSENAGLHLSTWLMAEGREAKVQTLAILTHLKEAPRELRTVWPLERVVFPSEPLEVHLEHDRVRLVHGPTRARGALTRRHGDDVVHLGWNLAFEGPPGVAAFHAKRGIRDTTELHGEVPSPGALCTGTVDLGERAINLRDVPSTMLHTWGASIPGAWTTLLVPTFREADAGLVLHAAAREEDGTTAVRGLLRLEDTVLPLRAGRLLPADGAHTVAFEAKGKGISLDGQAVLPGAGHAALGMDLPDGTQRHLYRSSVASAHIHVDRRDGLLGRSELTLGTVQGASLELGRTSPHPGLTRGGSRPRPADTDRTG